MIEASVSLDNKSRSTRRDCLAEGRKWLDKNAAEAASELKQDPQFFRDGGWSFERRYDVRSVLGDGYVSIVRLDYMDTHGAHPNMDVNTVLWDQAEKKRIKIHPLFNETADNGETMNAMLKAVIASLKVEKNKREAGETATAEWFKGLSRNS